MNWCRASCPNPELRGTDFLYWRPRLPWTNGFFKFATGSAHNNNPNKTNPQKVVAIQDENHCLGPSGLPPTRWWWVCNTSVEAKRETEFPMETSPERNQTSMQTGPLRPVESWYRPSHQVEPITEESGRAGGRTSHFMYIYKTNGGKGKPMLSSYHPELMYQVGSRVRDIKLWMLSCFLEHQIGKRWTQKIYNVNLIRQ